MQTLVKHLGTVHHRPNVPHEWYSRWTVPILLDSRLMSLFDYGLSRTAGVLDEPCMEHLERLTSLRNFPLFIVPTILYQGNLTQTL